MIIFGFINQLILQILLIIVIFLIKVCLNFFLLFYEIKLFLTKINQINNFLF